MRVGKVRNTPWLLVSLMLVLGCCCRSACSAEAADVEGSDFFESRIRPVLSAHCFECHSGKALAEGELKGGLRLDSREAALGGGDSGSAVLPGQPDESLLMSALRYDALEMPPSGQLEESVLRDFAHWIRIGAPWPDDRPALEPEDERLKDYSYWRANHWAWRPMTEPQLPGGDYGGWSVNAIDRFILARMNAAGLTPSPPAERAVLFRRLHFGLLGLPPSYEDVQRFQRDQRPDAYARAVDRLLASPAYGEHWGRHWLDIARYADNGGFNSQTKELYTDFPYAYTYRDYVIRALNEDLPYDRFILEQIAADKLELGDDNRAMAALGFLTLGDKSFGTSSQDRIDDCIDTVTRGLMGITVSCARCHDHKYDPIPTADYYSLFSVFQNSKVDVAARLHTREKSVILPPLFATRAERERFEREVEQATEQLEQAQVEYFEQAKLHLRQRLADYLLAAAQRADARRKAELNEELIKRWREYLKANSEHPVFLPWRVLSELDGDSDQPAFQAALERLFAAGSRHRRSNALVMEALREAVPQSLDQVAAAYAELLRRADEKQLVAEEEGAAEVLEVLAAEGSPLNLKRDEVLQLPIHGGIEQLKHLTDELRAARFEQPRAVAATDESELTEGHVLIRGNPRNRGPAVPRRFLALLAPQRQEFTGGSGRLELAQHIIDPENPLTARVIVNRVWRHHFGVGLVETPSDFGVRSDLPSHPELLDYLARRLIEDGWSLKELHRRILLSQTYRQASLDRPQSARIDQANRLLWRMNRQRLSFETLRDALLAASGELDSRLGGPAVATWESPRRTIYGYVNRYRIAAGYVTFDFPSPLRTAPKRSQTLVPQQSLFLMNAPFVQDRAAALVQDRDISSASDDAGRVVAIYRRVLSRDPEPLELEASLQFVCGNHPSSATASTPGPSVWQQLAHALCLSNEFSYVD